MVSSLAPPRHTRFIFFNGQHASLKSTVQVCQCFSCGWKIAGFGDLAFEQCWEDIDSPNRFVTHLIKFLQSNLVPVDEFSQSFVDSFIKAFMCWENQKVGRE